MRERDDHSSAVADDGYFANINASTGEATANPVILSGEDGEGSCGSDGNTRASIPYESSVAVDNTAQASSAIRAEAIAHARAVIDLCRLAGQPQMAGRFLEEDVGLDEVRSRLLSAEASPTSPPPMPNPGSRRQKS